MDLQEWFNQERERMEASNLYFKGPWDSQIMFVRDKFHFPLTKNYEERKANPVQVVSTHTSKSCKLPVYHIKGDDLEVWLRGNFYDWKISIRSQIEIPDVFYNLFDRNQKISPVYFEGFEPSWIFGDYASNHKEFSVELPYHNEIAFTFAYLLGQSIKPQALPANRYKRMPSPLIKNK